MLPDIQAADWRGQCCSCTHARTVLVTTLGVSMASHTNMPCWHLMSGVNIESTAARCGGGPGSPPTSVHLWRGLLPGTAPGNAGLASGCSAAEVQPVTCLAAMQQPMEGRH